jgi:hypothetical protein
MQETGLRMAEALTALRANNNEKEAAIRCESAPRPPPPSPADFPLRRDAP